MDSNTLPWDLHVNCVPGEKRSAGFPIRRVVWKFAVTEKKATGDKRIFTVLRARHVGLAYCEHVQRIWNAFFVRSVNSGPHCAVKYIREIGNFKC